MVRGLKIAGLACAALFVSLGARAANFSFTGTFASDTDLAYFTFTLAAPTAGVTLRTWSYAGGTNADGAVIPSGGFEPLLNLFLADGTQMNPGTSGPCTSPPTGNAVADLLPDGVTGACSDVYYPTEKSFPGGLWAAGTYIVVLSVAPNGAVGNLPDGFFADVVLGIPPGGNFTCGMFQGNPPAIPLDKPFCDAVDTNAQRDGHWALDLLNVDSASATAVPEPRTWALGIVSFLFAGLAMRRRKARAVAQV